MKDLKDGDPIQIKIDKEWHSAAFHGTVELKSATYVRVRLEGYRLYSYATKDEVRPAGWSMEKNNPNRTFKSRKE